MLTIENAVQILTSTTFIEMSDMERECFAGAEDGTKIGECDDKWIVLMSPNGMVTFVTESGDEHHFQLQEWEP